MRRIAACLIGLATAFSASAESKYLESVESPVVEVPGVSVSDLASRGRLCILKHVTYGDVVLRDESRVTPYSMPGSQAGNTTSASGGDVLQSVDLDAGLVVARSRVQMSSLMMRYSVESTITFEAREGRFKITQSAIRMAMLETGYAANNGFQPVLMQWGSPHKKVTETLQALATKIGECVAAPPSSDW